MSDSNLTENKLQDYTPSLQRVQAMDARGDFQFKGIYKAFMAVFDWTEKFGTTRVLPTIEQIEKESTIERERVEFFVNELCFRINPPILKKLVVVDFHGNEVGEPENPKTFLKQNTVFCRPTSVDAGSVARYMAGLNEASTNAIKSWIQSKREGLSKDSLQAQIQEALDNNKLFDTYASTQIGNLFQCSYDKTKAQKDATISLHLKPVLRKLVDDKVLFFLRNDRATKPGNKSIFLYNKPEEIRDRYEVFLSIIQNKILPTLQKLGVMGQVEASVWKTPKATLDEILSYLNEGYGDQKTLVEETILLDEIIQEEREREEKQKKKDLLEELLAYLEGVGRVVEVNFLRLGGEPLEDEFKAMLLSNNNILYAEFADEKIYNEFVLHKNCIMKAIESAKATFIAKKSNLEIRVLLLMNVYQNLSEESAKRTLEEIENLSLFQYLPFFTKLWRMIIGSIKVYNDEAAIIKARLSQKLVRDMQVQKQKLIQIEKEKIKQKLAKEKEDQERAAKRASKEGNSSKESSSKVLTEEEKKAEEAMSEILSLVDSAWDKGNYPDREYLLSKLNGKYTEDNLIFFLKKYGGKELYSYQVKNQGQTYPWPILITTSYLKKKGKALLDKSKAESQKQRDEKVPDQEKFDLADSLVDFLERTMPKIK